MVVVVVDRHPKEKPSFSRIYRPADLYLNGKCTDANGYYIEADQSRSSVSSSSRLSLPPRRPRRKRPFKAGRSRLRANTPSASKGRPSTAKDNLYVVNFGKPGTIGKLAAGASRSELFAVLPEGSIGNAIRFDREGRMFVADYKKHNIFLVSPDGKGRQNLLPFRRLQSAQRSDHRGRRHDLRERPALETSRRADLADRQSGRRHGRRREDDRERKMSTTNGIDLSPGRQDTLCGRVRYARDLVVPDRRHEPALAASW